jgi:hypothetical protein
VISRKHADRSICRKATGSAAITLNASIRRSSACSEVARLGLKEINFCSLQRRQWRLRLPSDAASTTGRVSLSGHRPSAFDRPINFAV